MALQSEITDSGPVREGVRIISLDLIRGVAVLGILLMNAVSFKLDLVPYLNLSAGGSETWLDWSVGILGALGLILVGAGLYRIGFMNGGLHASTYRLVAVVGLGIGLPLAIAGVIITAVDDYSREVAFIGQIPNTLGTIPASLGYMSLIILWNNRADNRLKQRLRAVGRMALTNYLTQTALGVLVLKTLLGDADFVNRSVVLVFVFAVWALQMWWSQAWLSRFLFGPMEWLWRVGTYRSGQPFRRPGDSRLAS